MATKTEGRANAKPGDTAGAAGAAAPSPPYLSFATFKNYIGELKASVIPTRIDAGAMQSKSGSDQSAIRTGMKFFQLVKDDDRPEPALRALCEAHGTPAWPDAVKKYILVAYDPIIGDISLDRATTPMVTEAFRAKTNLSGDTLGKAIRFYLSTLKDAEIPYSPYLKAPVVSRSPRKKKPARRQGEEPETNNGSDEELEVGDGMKAHTFNIPGRAKPVRVIAYEDITTAEWGMVGAYMAAYIELVKK